MTEAQSLSLKKEIKVLGIGNSGCYAVEQMYQCVVQNVECICIHTNTQPLSGSRTLRAIEFSRETMRQVRAAIAGTKMLFITVGLDDCANTETAAAIAREAMRMGIPTAGLVGEPCEKVDMDLADLKVHMNSLVVVPISRLHALTLNAVSAISAILNANGHVNVDLHDVHAVMSEPGRTILGTALASGPDRALLAAEQTIKSMQLTNAKAMLILVTGAKGSLKLSESRLATSVVSATNSPHAHLIYGTAYDDSLGDSIRVTVVASGLASAVH